MGGLRYTYRCRSCRAEFTSRRRQCEYCGTVGALTDRSDCRDCGARLSDSTHQRCPLCGATDLEVVAVVERE